MMSINRYNCFFGFELNNKIKVIDLHHVFILNPTAGKGRALHMLDKINSRFEDFGQTYEIKMTEAPGHALVLSRQAVSTYDNVRLYSVGGDGTLNEIVNGIAGSRAELGIIPCGSGNDAVKSIYSITDPVKLIEILPTSPSALFDLGKINEKYYINIASIGFDAYVTIKSQAFKQFPLVSGSLAYILGILTALIQLKKYKVRIAIEEASGLTSRADRECLMAVFANGSYYGGGMKPAPRAEMNDGLLDFCIVEPINRVKIFKFFPAFKKGLHESMKEVTLARGVRAVFESDDPFPVNIDGEVSTETKVSLEIVPSFLKIIIPS